MIPTHKTDVYNPLTYNGKGTPFLFSMKFISSNVLSSTTYEQVSPQPTSFLSVAISVTALQIKFIIYFLVEE